MTFDELVAALDAVDGLRNTGRVHPNFQFRSKPFLHFHSGDGGTYADVKFDPDADFEPVPASTPEERRALLARVEAHVAANPPKSRQRSAG